jgi:hypothetical protein
MFVYADQNFLIRCRDDAEVKSLVISAHRSGKATFVLSPIHFYEIGTVKPELYQSTVQFVEEIQPSWILSRVDLQWMEFLCQWKSYWKLGEFKFDPIGDLAHVASVLHRKPRERFAGLTPRDFIDSFVDPTSLTEIKASFEMNQKAREENRARFKAGQFTSQIMNGIERAYVAAQLARFDESEPILNELYGRAKELLISEPTSSRISIFVENGWTRRLRANAIESSMTYGGWNGEARMNENSQVDRDHAVVSLAYCDVFVTNDGKLRKYCEQVQGQSEFALAQVFSCSEWIEQLRSM